MQTVAGPHFRESLRKGQNQEGASLKFRDPGAPQTLEGLLHGPQADLSSGHWASPLT